MQISAFENPQFGTTAVPTVMQSGTTTNTVPALAKLDIDVRSFTLAELNRIDKSIRGLKSEIAEVQVSGGISRPPLEESSCIELYEKLEEVAKKLGLGKVGSASVGGASDGNIAASTGAKVLDGLGAVGTGAHAPNESIKISEVEPRIKLTSAFINELLK
jgi:glutamate carboxypeptidase